MSLKFKSSFKNNHRTICSLHDLQLFRLFAFTPTSFKEFHFRYDIRELGTGQLNFPICPSILFWKQIIFIVLISLMAFFHECFAVFFFS